MKIINYDVKDKQSDYKQKVPFMPDRCFRMLVCGPSGSGKTNLLLDMIYRLLFYDKIYLHAKNLQQSTSCSDAGYSRSTSNMYHLSPSGCI